MEQKFPASYFHKMWNFLARLSSYQKNSAECYSTALAIGNYWKFSSNGNRASSAQYSYVVSLQSILSDDKTGIFCECHSEYSMRQTLQNLSYFCTFLAKTQQQRARIENIGITTRIYQIRAFPDTKNNRKWPLLDKTA